MRQSLSAATTSIHEGVHTHPPPRVPNPSTLLTLPTPQDPSTSEAGTRPAELSHTSLEWLLQTVARGDDAQRQLLGALAARHINRRRVLQGNVLLLPLLGRRLFVEAVGLGGDCAHVVSAARNTVTLLAPTADARPAEDSQAGAVRVDTQRIDTEALVTRARLAAEEAVAAGARQRPALAPAV